MLVVSAVLVFILIIGVMLVRDRQAMGELLVEYTPQAASVYINDKKVSSVNKLKPGSYKVSVIFDGFTTYEKDITIKKDETKSVYVILKPNAYYTQDWYETHPDDAKIRENILASSVGNGSEHIINEHPLLSLLPYVGPRGGFRIDYGKSSNPESMAIYISYYTDVGREKAEEWIVKQGFRLEDYEIIYNEKQFGVE